MVMFCGRRGLIHVDSPAAQMSTQFGLGRKLGLYFSPFVPSKAWAPSPQPLGDLNTGRFTALQSFLLTQHPSARGFLRSAIAGAYSLVGSRCAANPCTSAGGLPPSFLDSSLSDIPFHSHPCSSPRLCLCGHVRGSR